MSANAIRPNQRPLGEGHDGGDKDHNDWSFEQETTLSAIGKSKTINFTIRANYTNWKPREAFRELVQNWYADCPSEPSHHGSFQSANADDT